MSAAPENKPETTGAGDVSCANKPEQTGMDSLFPSAPKGCYRMERANSLYSASCTSTTHGILGKGI